MTNEQTTSILEDTAASIKKLQVNLKKCPKTRLTKGYLEARLNALEEYWCTLKQSHTELVKNTTKEQKGLLPYFVHEDYYSHEELYFGVKADLRDMLTDSSTPMQQSENINSSCVQLPKIHLPTFSGHYDEWQTFEDLFVSLVHDNVNISEAQKLHYLKCSVTGEAEMLLKHIKVTHTNYKQAWDILKGRYGNKRLIINSVLKKLFNQKKLTNQSPNHLKKLLDSTTDCLHNLNNLKINTSSWDPIIIYLVVQKLDIDSHREWEESAYKTTEELPTWLELKEFLESKYRTLELVSFPIPTRERTKEHTFHIAKSSLPPPQPSPRSCIKCHDNHTLCHCKIFSVMNTEERRDFVKSSNLCFNCLAPGHSVARCRVPMSCRLCHRRHHSLLHVDSTEINKAQVTPTSVNNCVEQTHTRNEEGRYIVKLPFKTDNPRSPEGNTKDIAMNRLLQLERKFKRLPKLREEYTKVMEEYIQLEHMEEVPRTEINNRSVYLPHHAIVNPEKESTKTRVVFDASCKEEGIPMMVSLNDELLVGPQLQEDLRNLLMRWRMKKICFIADITQMYRQLLVTKSQADYQRILWRADSSKDVQTYRLLRVTFGTASAPYLAVKTLHQIAKDETPEMENTLDDDIKQNITHTYLPAVRTIKEDFYMDDLISGADEVKQAIDLANTITEILEKGCFTLTKWASNSVDFMKAIKPEKRSIHAQLDLNMDGTMKALGIAWNLKKDEFLYTQNLPPRNLSITKRTILSDIQKIFDPLGWIAPTIISAKMLIQKLWLAKSNWDDEVDPTLKEEWSVLRSDFEGVKDIRIDRWLHTNEKSRIQFHGFSDASMNAYAAAVYIRVENADGSINTKLIASRARVAPVKTISVPRLELCGALLLSKLMRQIGDAMREPTANMFAWTDSLIVIAWLSGEPNKWKPYVANRVVEITEIISSDRWFHVQSQDNPADIASRGMLLRDLKECELWWRGPKWLFKNKLYISKPDILSTTLELKEKYIQTNVHITGKETKESREDNTKINFDNFTTLTDLLKTICYCRRLLTYCKIKDNETGPSALTTAEFEHALKVCIKIAQKEEFEIDIENLKKKKTLDKRSKLKRLNPYLDEDGMLRVGGRLRHADLQDYHKHPIILGDKSILTLQIVANAHKKTLHGGLQLMLAYLQSKFWIIKAKILVKSHIYRCLICARYNAVPRTQLMGDLPKERVTPTRPFLHSGVDFAGPISVLMSRGRGAKVTKAYISIFICLSTKAIHLELVGDLTSQSFIAAFKRFVSRRGKCIHLWSDQGRNFVGANKELTQAWQAANFEFDKVTNLLTLDGTQWHFIPAYSPNFGGLWEAGVKSIKYHLKRILTTNLIFEEMSTVLCEIEAVLNSRPISAMDDDITPLTPGHFLIGEVPIVVPGPSLENIKVHNLARWQHTQKLLGDFWRRWQNEYLTRLQQRPKWLKEKKDFEKGDIVLIKMDGLPPGKWSLGRIVDKHPGADNLTRVYSVKSGEHITKRSVTKLCAMPIDTSTTE